MAVSRPHRFTVDEYERMIQVGILDEEDRVELIRGEIVEMSPIGGPHNACLNRATRSAVRQTSDDFYVQVQGPVRLSGDAEPVPDLAIIRVGYDERRPPLPQDVLLVVEVSDTSLSDDRGTKLPLYATAGIAEAWLFILNGRRLERHTEPGSNGYRTVAIAELGQRLESTTVAGLVFSADQLFGR